MLSLQSLHADKTVARGSPTLHLSFHHSFHIFAFEEFDLEATSLRRKNRGSLESLQ